MTEPPLPPLRVPDALRRAKGSIRRLCASLCQRPFFTRLVPGRCGLAPRASIENRAPARRDRDQHDSSVDPNQMERVLRCERKTLDGLKLAPHGRGAGLQPKASHSFAAKKIESTAKQHQHTDDCKQ